MIFEVSGFLGRCLRKCIPVQGVMRIKRIGKRKVKLKVSSYIPRGGGVRRGQWGEAALIFGGGSLDSLKCRVKGALGPKPWLEVWDLGF